MTWQPDACALRGVPYGRAELYGKPGIGASYTRFDARSYRLDEMARCCICGRMATNAHHWPPLGAGGGGRQFLLRTPLGRFVLLPPLFAVCGNGNASGCHKAWHSGQISVEWVWDDDAYAKDWWNGTMLKFTKPGKWLFHHGCYRFSNSRTGREWEYRAKEGERNG